MTNKSTKVSKGCFYDKHILAADKIFEKQFPQLQGLQSTLLSQTEGFSPISVKGNCSYETKRYVYVHDHFQMEMVVNVKSHS